MCGISTTFVAVSSVGAESAENSGLVYLNDFKLLCPSYNLVAQGQTCEACKGGAFWHALTLRPSCYPGLGAAHCFDHRGLCAPLAGTYRECVDLFLAPSEFVRDKFVRARMG